MEKFESRDYSLELINIAEQILSTEGLEVFHQKIDIGDIKGARIVILGAVDRRVEDGQIDIEKAREIYTILEFSPDEASKLRQNHASGVVNKRSN